MSLSPRLKPAQRTTDGASSTRSKYSGKRLGKFQIVGELGRGGMGVVLEARDTVLDRHVAIKLLPRSVAEQPEALERFLREARAAAKLQHPHVVAVYDADQVNGQYYIVMELIRGGNLQDAVAKGPLPWIEATRAMVEACRGLVVAHRAGLVHRDIKPANLMRSEEGAVKLADFGLARGGETGASMTGSGSVLGTPQFMSPEQCRSELADERSDVYAMGATYFALLTGRVPYPGQAPLLVMNAHLLDPVPDPRDVDPAIPAGCAEVVKRAMAKEPEDRYADAQALLTDLEAALESGRLAAPGPQPSRPPETSASEPAPTRRVGKTKVQHAERDAYRVMRWIGVALLLGIVALVGWSMRNRVSRPSAEVPATLADDGEFRLPGLTRDEPQSDSEHERWSRSYPGITQLSVANSGEFLAVITNDAEGRVHVWNRAGKRVLDEPVAGRATSVAISPDGRRLAVGTSGGNGVWLWNSTNWRRETAAPSDDDVTAVAWSPDGRWLAFATAANKNDGAWVLWDVGAGKPSRRTVVPNSGRIGAIAFGAEDELFVLTGQSGQFSIWRALESDQKPREHRVGVMVNALAVAPRRSQAAVASGKYFSLWSYQQNRRDHAVLSTEGDVACVAFAATGREVAWAAGTTVNCLEAESRRPIATLQTSNSPVISVALTPDASQLLAATKDGKLVSWRLKK